MLRRYSLVSTAVLSALLLIFTVTVFADTTVTVQPGDSLGRIAQRYGTTVQAIADANGIVNPNFIYVGQVLVIPGVDDGTDDGGDNSGGSGGSGGAASSYTVQSGDSLSGIAARFGVTLGELAAANSISNPNFIYVGQVLVIPGSGGSSGGGDPQPTATPSPANPTPTPTPSSGGTSSTYVVQAGDTLASIARRFNVSLAELQSANGIVNPNYIYVGQVLIIPGAGGSSGGGGGSGGGSPTATPTPTPQPQPTATSVPSGGATGNFALGGQTHTLANPGTMQDIGMTWVKFQHKWGSSDSPNVVAGRVSDAHARGFKVLLSMPGANTYPSSIDFAGYVNFVIGVASLPDPPDAIEIWNEMNIDFEWPAGTISPQQYVDEMLRPAYQGIKAANPNVMVISGAPAPTGFDNTTNAWADDRYMAGLAAAGAANYMDCVGVHHNAGATAPSATSGHPGGGHYSWYFFPTLNLYYNAFNGARPVCFTEIGYVTGEDFGGTLPQNFAWANGTSLSEHAAWLAEAVTLARNNGNVEMMILFNVDFDYYDPQGDPQAGFALIRPNGSCPACEPIKAAMGR